MPSEVVAMAETTVFICPLAVLNAMRVPPKPLNESAPLLAVEISVQAPPAFVERRMPMPKYESPELFASLPLHLFHHVNIYSIGNIISISNLIRLKPALCPLMVSTRIYSSIWSSTFVVDLLSCSSPHLWR